jgi:hypothetical protein
LVPVLIGLSDHKKQKAGREITLSLFVVRGRDSIGKGKGANIRGTAGFIGGGSAEKVSAK